MTYETHCARNVGSKDALARQQVQLTCETQWEKAVGKKPRTGRTPDLLRKSGPMRDRSKYDRKRRPGESSDWAQKTDPLPFDEVAAEEKDQSAGTTTEK